MSNQNIPARYFPIVPASYVLLRKGNQILLLKRFNTGYMDGKYSLPAGHFDGDESADQVVVREAKEELDIAIKISDLRLVHVVNYPDISGEYERLSLFFETTRWQGNPKNNEPNKCSEIKWVEINSLPKNMTPEAKLALDGITAGSAFSTFGLE